MNRKLAWVAYVLSFGSFVVMVYFMFKKNDLAVFGYGCLGLVLFCAGDELK